MLIAHTQGCLLLMTCGEQDFVGEDAKDALTVDSVRTLSARLSDASGSRVLLDCHIAVGSPADYIDSLASSGAGQITFHSETITDMEVAAAMCKSIRSRGIQVGVAIKASSGIEMTRRFIEYCLAREICINTILLLSIPRHVGGLPLLPMVFEKVRRLRKLFPSINIQACSVDGGVRGSNCELLGRAGANVVVAGSAVFKADNMQSAVGELISSLARGYRSRTSH
eukprot:scaffold735_cov376-Prasinococcus_capsulatus_cf.AAC.22